MTYICPMETSIIQDEKCASHLQMTIKHYLGRTITKDAALLGYQLHVDGDGGNTVGWKFEEMYGNGMNCTHKQHTVLGDAIIDLGRMATENPKLTWCFPESYRAYREHQIN